MLQLNLKVAREHLNTGISIKNHKLKECFKKCSPVHLKTPFIILPTNRKIIICILATRKALTSNLFGVPYDTISRYNVGMQKFKRCCFVFTFFDCIYHPHMLSLLNCSNHMQTIPKSHCLPSFVKYKKSIKEKEDIKLN